MMVAGALARNSNRRKCGPAAARQCTRGAGVISGPLGGNQRTGGHAWGPARARNPRLSSPRAAAGLAVTHSYRHTDADGTRSEGHGVFTIDPDHPETLWYHVNSMGLPPERARPRAAGMTATLTVERRSDRGTARHTFRVDDGVLTHAAGLRLGQAAEFTAVHEPRSAAAPKP